jgi:hypothetical protein
MQEGGGERDELHVIPFECHPNVGVHLYYDELNNAMLRHAACILYSGKKKNPLKEWEARGDVCVSFKRDIIQIS